MGGRQRLQRIVAALALFCVLVTAVGDFEAQAQGTDDLAALRAQVTQLKSQGKSPEAVPIAERYVSLARQRYGDDHAEYATAIGWLASVYRAQGRYADAEPLYKRALVITEKVLGPDHRNVGGSLNNLAELYRAQDRYADAEPLYKRALAIAEKVLGPDHPHVGATLNNMPKLSPCTSGRWSLLRRCWDPITPMSAPRSTTWPCCTKTRAAMPMPRPCTSGR
jgi:tetratricopeptide (TPR) repeat protein